MKRTKIVCTIGPASNSESMIRQLIQAGMNVARLNFSHGTHEEHEAVMQRIRKVSEELKQPVAILQDIAGPKIRVGVIENGPVMLKTGAKFVITDEEVMGNEQQVSVNYKNLPQLVQPGDQLLLSDGMLELEVLKADAQRIECRVIVGGPLNSHKGVNLPTRTTGIPVLTEKDHLDLAFGLKCGVDYVALSFVRSAQDIVGVRREIEAQGGKVPLIAKIEKPEALQQLDEILKVVDGVMVARGDLGVELPFEQVPLAQKEIIRKANAAYIPVITATQMLESMVDSPRPTRAEVNDVANAILDGTDAVMLSEESAMGKYPVLAVKAMVRIAEDVERGFPYGEWLQKFDKTNRDDVERSVSHAACDMADSLDVEAIVTTTMGGLTARQAARFRPQKRILAPTPNAWTYRRLALIWGVTPLLIAPAVHTDDMIRVVFEAILEAGLAKEGEKVVVSAGIPLAAAGQTNLLAVLEIGRKYGWR